MRESTQPKSTNGCFRTALSRLEHIILGRFGAAVYRAAEETALRLGLTSFRSRIEDTFRIEPMLTVKAIDHIVFNVRDVDASARWYERVLGMLREDHEAPSGDIRTSMMFGPNKINLRPLSATQEAWFTGRMPCAGSDDICFLTDASPDDVARHRRENGVEIVLGPVTKRGARGAICSVYIRDPDGNLVEVSSYSSPPSLALD